MKKKSLNFVFLHLRLLLLYNLFSEAPAISIGIKTDKRPIPSFTIIGMTELVFFYASILSSNIRQKHFLSKICIANVESNIRKPLTAIGAFQS